MGCAHEDQSLLQTQPLCVPCSCVTAPWLSPRGWLSHLGTSSPPGAPGQPGPVSNELCGCNPESQNHRQRAHGGLGPSRPSLSTPAPLPAPGGCQARSIQLRSLGKCHKTFPRATRGPLCLGETWSKAEGTEILQEQDLEHIQK